MKKLKITALLIVFGGVLGILVKGNVINVYADSGSGSGGSSNSSKGCSTANYFVTNVCSDNGKKTGGASWHIFKTKDPSDVWTNYGLYKRKGGPYYCKTYDAHNSSGCSRFNALSGGGYDKKLATNCPKSRFDYYAVYVTDGWYKRDSKGNKKNIPTYFGPLAWDTKYSGVSFQYNTTNAMAWDTLKTKLTNNEAITDGQKISAGAAKQLCKADTGEGPCKDVTTADIPKGTGYICVSYPHDVTLTAYARDTDGNALNNGNIIDSNTISVPPRGSGEASVNIISISGYVFKGWRETDTTSGDYVSTSNTFTKTISANTKVYAYYEKEEIPPFSVESKLEIKVANNSVIKLKELRAGSIYAKPGDELVFETNYNSLAQTGASKTANRITVNGGEERLSNNGTETLQQMFNNYPGSYGQWSNGFTVTSENFISPYKETYNLEVGKELNTKDRNTHTVSGNEVGKELKETASTLKNEAGLGTTPYKVEVTSAGLGRVSTGLEKSASAIVPYNFTIDATIGSFDDPDDPTPYADEDTPEDEDLSNGDDNPDKENEVIFAGEEKEIVAEIQVGDKPNELTTDNSEEEAYSTRADDLSYRLIQYDPSKYGKKDGGIMDGGRDSENMCEEHFDFREGEEGCELGDLTGIESLQSGEKRSIKPSLDVEDWPAGKSLCVALAVFPVDSGLDSNTRTDGYSNAWRISKSKCFMVAKRPSIQILGGNVYSKGDIKTGLSVKKKLEGHENDGTYIFGSWGELGVISTGRVEGLASGATIGNPLGYHGERNICRLSPLSFANADCDKGYTGDITSSAVSGINADKDSIKNFVEKFKGDGAGVEFNDNDTVTITEEDTTNSYYHASGTLNVNASTIGIGTIKVIHASSIMINGDINYYDNPDTPSYNKLEQIPKLVIYGEKSITIGCNVGEIDALLLAETVKTCNSDNINSNANSNRLRIRGAVLANRLIANRTYGAATGDNSIISAEEINFDPTLYMWGGDDSDEGEGNSVNNDIVSIGKDLEMVYIRDIPPRY